MIKMHLFVNRYFVQGTEDSLRAVLYNRTVVGEIVTPKNHDSDPI